MKKKKNRNIVDLSNINAATLRRIERALIVAEKSKREPAATSKRKPAEKKYFRGKIGAKMDAKVKPERIKELKKYVGKLPMAKPEHQKKYRKAIERGFWSRAHNMAEVRGL